VANVDHNCFNGNDGLSLMLHCQ